MNNYNIALFGGRGYVGQEIIKLLDKHPLFFLKKAYSSSAHGKYIENYSKDKSLKFLKLDGNDIELDNIDIARLIAAAAAAAESHNPTDRIAQAAPHKSRSRRRLRTRTCQTLL